MNTKQSYYVTTPIYYVNDKPHIGHAYTSLACDVLARHQRWLGNDVMFLTGTDEHGQKVQQSAEKRGVSPQAFTDEVSETFRLLAGDMGYSNDDFIRTTEPRHHKAAQALWQRIADKGDIYLGTYSGWYAVRDEAYYQPDELIEGEGGQKLAPTGAPVEWVEESSYFFRLSAYEDRLMALYENQPDFIMPKSRRNEVMSFVKGGLKDLSCSRTTFDWGIPVPGDENHVMYVWFDALTNYLTAAGYPDNEPGSDGSLWPASLHVVGKDILRFHAVYWPAFLMAADLPLPKRVFAHGWWTNEGQKISKSLGNVINPYDLIQDYGLDQTRYFLLREVPFGNDGDFARDAMAQRMNSDLANAYGNLAQRSLSMAFKNCNAQIPVPGSLTDDDQALIDTASKLMDQVGDFLDQQAFHKALEAVWSVIGDANSYIDAQAPWTLKKTDPARMQTVLYTVLETVRRVTLILQPFMPTSCEKLLDALAVDATSRSADSWDMSLVGGTAINKPEGVFPRYVAPEE